MKTTHTKEFLKRIAFCCALLALLAARADTHIWTGQGMTAYWSDTHNWDNGNSPSAGEPAPVVLRFPSMALQTFNTNDIAGLTIDTIRLDRAGYVIDLGNATLAGSVIMQSPFPGQSRLYGDPLLAGDVQFDIDTDLALVILAQVGGNGGLTKLGNGTLQLAGKNAYKDMTRVDTGCIEVTHDAGLGETAAGTAQSVGACLRLVNVLIKEESFALGGTFEAAGTNECTGPVAIPCDSLVITATTDDQLTLSGILSGDQILTKRGAGRLILTGEDSNTYNGELHAAEGVTLLAKKPSGTDALDAFAGPVFVGTTPAGPTAILQNVQNDQIPDKGVVNMLASGRWEIDGNKEAINELRYAGGGGVNTGPGQLTLTGDITVVGDGGPTITTSLLNGNVSLDSSVCSLIVSNDANLEIYATLGDGSNPAGLRKLGNGVVRLRSPNLFSELVNVDEGVLDAVHDEALGSPSAGTVVSSGASMALSSMVTIRDEPLVLNGNGYAGNGALYGNALCTWAGPITLATAARIFSEPGGEVHLRGVISGPAGFEKAGDGRVVLEGNDSNTFGGSVNVSLGQLQLTKTNAVAIPGPLVVGGGAALGEVVVLEPEQIASAAPVNVNVPGRLSVVGVNEAIGSLHGDGELACPQGALHVGVNNMNTHFAGPISGDGVLNLVKVGTGSLRLSGVATQTGGTMVQNGTVFVDGTFTAGLVTVEPDGTLGGNGNLFAVSVNGGTVAPGNSPGALHIQSIPFTASSRYVAELNGTLPGSHDQLDVSGGMNLANATLEIVPGFMPATGDTFMIVTRPAAAPPPAGTFAGLPEGTKFVRAGIAFEITYMGGDGNDVVLRVIPSPTPAKFTDIIPFWPLVKIGAEGTPDWTYILEANDSLTSPASWMVIGNALANPNGVLVINDNDAVNHTNRFYRFRLP
ncbi:MAG: autotransporter-associated beta strand repeat-containing protein [Verrucomicrobia subdivision 3 bacterium]|nr:autotransporter-associated beta strand repeat-containing protein [Limisphaerales bacterium]